MTLNIDKFMAVINSEDIARNNLFQVIFDGKRPVEPSALESLSSFGIDIARANIPAVRAIEGVFSPELIRAAGGGDLVDAFFQNPVNKENLSFFVTGITVPGIEVASTDYFFDNFYTTMPTGKHFGDLVIKFMMQPSGMQRAYFINAQKKVINESFNSVGFFDQYTTNIKLLTYDRDGSLKTATEFISAWVSNVGELEYTYSDAGEAVTFDVTFQIGKYEGPVPASDTKEDVNQFNKIKDTIRQVRTIANQLSIPKPLGL